MLLPVLVLVAAACVTPTAGATEVALGQEVLLATGETAKVKGKNLEMTFVDVLEDSRCPKDVTCAQPGQARMAVIVRYNGVSREGTTVEPGLINSRVTYSHYGPEFRFHVRLEPYPQAGVATEKNAYRLNLIVTPQ